MLVAAALAIVYSPLIVLIAYALIFTEAPRCNGHRCYGAKE